MSMDTTTTRIVELAEQLADRFERIGLDENGNMDKADKKLLERLRAAIEERQRMIKGKI
jgi:hypothetical protein